MVSQRLIRILCDNCKEPAKLSHSQIEDFRQRNLDHTQIYRARGCEYCGNTGYRGRTAIFDMLVFDDKLKDALSNNRLPLAEMRNQGDQRGKSNLRKEGLRKVFSGVTSMEELERVLG
jgi:type II secretory ATPase GspE/PulE/Tfp pilus assembly ATPase PilB-like protein